MRNAWLPEVRSGEAAPEALLSRREAINGMPQPPDAEGDLHVGWTTLAGLRTLMCRPSQQPLGSILYLHGGGYRLGAPNVWRAYSTRVASTTGCTVYVPDYSLAPERPFPAALHDVDACCRALTDEGATLILSGDSAGGGLAISYAAARARAGHDGIAGLILLSPWLDLTVTAETYCSRAERDVMFSREAAIEAAGQYLQGHPADDPLVTPLFGDLRGVPPTLVFVGTEEVLLDDALQLSTQLAHADVSVELHVERDAPHTFPAILPQLPGSKRALHAMDRFVRRCFDREDE